MRLGATNAAVTFSNGVASTLPTLGGPSSEAWAIDDNGDVAGGASILGNWNFHAALWTAGGVIDLGMLADDYESVATALNNNGQVVGYSRHYGASSAIFWNGVLYDLNELVSAPGFHLHTAVGINDAGLIVGYGADNSGSHMRAFVLTPGPDVADECDAIVPANIGSGLSSAQLATEGAETCGPMDSDDGVGKAAFGYTPYSQQDVTHCTFFDGMGNAAGGFTAPRTDTFFSQPSGFTGLTSGPNSVHRLMSYSHTGDLLTGVGAEHGLSKYNPYDFQVARGGSAFLVPPYQGASDILVSAATGRTCGTIPTTGRAGRDGTVLRQDNRCSYHYWPQLLQ